MQQHNRRSPQPAAIGRASFPARITAHTSNERAYINIDIFKNVLKAYSTQQIRGSIVVSIPACHAGDRGSIPRHGELSFSFLSHEQCTNYCTTVLKDGKSLPINELLSEIVK